MKRHDSSQTKIIATIGPACSSKEVLRKMFYEGIDVCRLNFSHGSHDDHLEVIKTINEINEEMGTSIAILADLQGPKLRIGEVEKGTVLDDNDILEFTNEDCLGNAKKVYMSYEHFPFDVNIGDTILIDDGKLKLVVTETNRKDSVKAKVVHGGPLSSKKGVNLPNTKISLPSLTEKDIRDAEFALDHNVDWIALSFVRYATDVVDLKELIRKKKKHTKVISKIEKPEALREIKEIIDLSNAIMIARGDLGVEVPFDQVPIIQKQIVRKCIDMAKPVIIATQMMESMITNFRPTRAEANDVANAVLDNADAVMLSGETSVGKYPADAIRNMQKIIDATEGKGFDTYHEVLPSPDSLTFLPDSLCLNAANLAKQVGAKAIIVLSYTGYTGFRIASHRPQSDIFVFTTNAELVPQMSLAWGIRAIGMEHFDQFHDFIEKSTNYLKEKHLLKQGDIVIHVSSVPVKERGLANSLKLGYV